MERLPPPEKAALSKVITHGVRHISRHNQFEFDVHKLIQLTQESPETMVSVTDFLDDLKDTNWVDDNDCVVSPQEVINVYRAAGSAEAAIVAHPELSSHIKKIVGADYSSPVLVFESRVIDGMHRFVKAMLDGQTLIKARVIEKIPTEAII